MAHPNTVIKKGNIVTFKGIKHKILSVARIGYTYQIESIETGVVDTVHKSQIELINVHNYNKGDQVYYNGEDCVIDHQISEDRFSVRTLKNPIFKGLTIVHVDDLSPYKTCGVEQKTYSTAMEYNIDGTRQVRKHENIKDQVDPKNVTITLPGVIELGTGIPMATPNPSFIDGNTNQLLRDLSETFQQCVEIAYKKNADYAGNADPFKNFRGSTHVGVDPKRAILVRMMDKMARISNLIDKEAQVKSESIDDTLMDVINYAAILKSYIKRNAK